MLKANTLAQAMELAYSYFAGSFCKDDLATQNAGYPVYVDQSQPSNYICLLGDRVEVNFANGNTRNIWIEQEKVKQQESADVIDVNVVITSRNTNDLQTCKTERNYRFANIGQTNAEIRQAALDASPYLISGAYGIVNKIIRHKILI